MGDEGTGSGSRSTLGKVARRVKAYDPRALADRVEELEAEVARLRDDTKRLAGRDARNRAKVEEQRAQLTAYGYAYRALRAALAKVPGSTFGPARTTAPDAAARREAEGEAVLVQHHAALAQALAGGADLPAAVTALVRNGLGAERTAVTRRVAQSLQAHPATAPVGDLAMGLSAHGSGLPGYAWDLLGPLPDALWMHTVPGEYLELAGEHDPDRAATALDALLAHAADGGEVHPYHWLRVVRAALGHAWYARVPDLRAALAAAVERETARGTATDEERALWPRELAWLDDWTPRLVDGPATPALPAGTVAIGVMGYRMPDRTRCSTNIGDFVQTLGSLAHVVRHEGVDLGDDELGRFGAELAARVPASLRVPAPAGSGPRKVALVEVDRDASHLGEIPDGTWLLGFGWYAHRIGGIRHDFPFDARLRPLYVSFHVARRSLLSPEAVEHLRAAGPIGCRDWSTVDLLLSLDVPAFFSGCLTTTVRYLSPDGRPQPGPDAPVAYVDVDPPAGSGGRKVLNERPEVARQDLMTNLREALGILDAYAEETSEVVTRRLHAYLPARALGRPVDFAPRVSSDPRFNGLAPLTDDEVHAMGAGIADLLAPVVGLILDGADEATVRARWSEVTAERVAQARARRDRPLERPVEIDVDALVAPVLAGRVQVPATAPADGAAGEPVDVVLALDAHLKEHFPVVVAGLVGASSRPVRLHVLSRDHGPDDHARAAALFPEVDWDWLPCDEVGYGEVSSMIAHITVSTMDRLLLPALLPEVSRVVYHDIDALPVADLAPLFDLDLGETPLAARDSEVLLMASGFSNVFEALKNLHHAPEHAFELIRREFARHRYDFTGFNAGVLVLDLDRMRAEDFCADFLPYAAAYGMNDQQILNCYTGPRRTRLDNRWNMRPSQEVVRDPLIVHWAGLQKPWDPGYVPFRAAWDAARADVARRAAAAGPGATPLAR